MNYKSKAIEVTNKLRDRLMKSIDMIRTSNSNHGFARWLDGLFDMTSDFLGYGTGIRDAIMSGNRNEISAAISEMTNAVNDASDDMLKVYNIELEKLLNAVPTGSTFTMDIQRKHNKERRGILEKQREIIDSHLNNTRSKLDMLIAGDDANKGRPLDVNQAVFEKDIHDRLSSVETPTK